MASAFTWLDHSDKERRKVLEAIARFKESNTRDELGLASIRDGFSDHFFPGTGVLMTHARYFLFVPWMYLDLERRGALEGVPNRVLRAEVQLIEALGDQPGNIGRRSKQDLQRMPSSIYWLGLAAWGIRTFRGTQGEYEGLLKHGSTTPDNQIRDDDGEPMEGRIKRNWHAGVPREPKGFPKQASFDLTEEEAAFLKERIHLSAPRSLLAFLFKNPLPNVPFAWLHPSLGSLPHDIQNAILHAQRFAEAMQGAGLLYNLMLAEAAGHDTVEDFRKRIGDWCTELSSRAADLAHWDLSGFWTLVRAISNVRDPTARFVNQWLELRTWEDPRRARDDLTARQLIQTREQRLKGPRARLTNPRALELWGGESGTARLSFRWPTALEIASDIVAGLEGRGRNA